MYTHTQTYTQTHKRSETHKAGKVRILTMSLMRKPSVGLSDATVAAISTGICTGSQRVMEHEQVWESAGEVGTCVCGEGGGGGGALACPKSDRHKFLLQMGHTIGRLSHTQHSNNLSISHKLQWMYLLWSPILSF